MELEDLEVQHFFIGGGAEHSAEQVRRLVYGILQGAEGISEPVDLKVRPYAVPGGGVRIAIGSGYAVSRYAGAVRETYFGSVTREQSVPVPANTSTAIRRDLVVMRVRDPYVQGSQWEDPGAGIIDDEEAARARAGAQYVFIEVIPSVPAGTTRLQDVPGFEDDTALTLARLDIPPATGTISVAMIVDLRSIARPREQTVVRAFDISGADPQPLNSGGAYPDGATWPLFAESTGEISIDIPWWATQVAWVNMIAGIAVPGGGQAQGWLWMQLGQNVDPNVKRSNPTRWDVDATSERHRVTLVTADTINIPEAMRGRTVKFFPRGNRTAGTAAHTLIADNGTSVAMMLTFREVRE